MLKPVKKADTGYKTYYIDSANNKREVKHSIVIHNEPIKEQEERIVQDIYRVFNNNNL